MSSRATPFVLRSRPLLKLWQPFASNNSFLANEQKLYSGLSVTAREGSVKNGSATPSPSSTANEPRDSSGLERLPTSSLLRNYFMGAVFTSPILFKLAFTILERVANSRSSILNPDSNPLLRALVKPLIYDQFCAGTNQSEIFRTRDTIKKIGYSGIILCYGKEMQISTTTNELRSTGKDAAADGELDWWLKGNLETLDMVGEGDWLGMKLTGAGTKITTALMQSLPPPEEFTTAMNLICTKARSKNCRIWIDAEQQALQPGIDAWTLSLMREQNPLGKEALLYTTLQAYLKSARTKLRSHLALADSEGWKYAVKLVRGAYIANDRREVIHDTKGETDESYNGIVRDLLEGRELGFEEGKGPEVQLFLAGHNPESVRRAWDGVQELSAKGRLRVVPDFGQLQGMADELGCKVLRWREEVMEKGEGERGTVVAPRIYKCLTWGSVQECMQYLLRRIVENRGGAERMKDGMRDYAGEIRRRAFGGRRRRA